MYFCVSGDVLPQQRMNVSCGTGTPVARVVGAAPRLRDEGVDQRRLMRRSWRVTSAYIGCVCGLAVAPALQQRLRQRRRHQEAHLLAVAPRRHVDADHATRHRRRPARRSCRGSASHRRRSAAGSCVRPGRCRCPRRPRSRRRAGCPTSTGARPCASGADAPRNGSGVKSIGGAPRAMQAQQRQIVDHIDRQQFGGAAAASRHREGEAVALGPQRKLADDVVVGDRQAAGVDHEARAHEAWLSWSFSSVRTCSSWARVAS